MRTPHVGSPDISLPIQAADGIAMPKQKTCRYDSSLGLLTKKFVALIQVPTTPAPECGWLRAPVYWAC